MIIATKKDLQIEGLSFVCSDLTPIILLANTFLQVCEYIFFNRKTIEVKTAILSLKGGFAVIYYTGDIHGQKYDIVRFCKRNKPLKNDIIIILGDVGANYSLDTRDVELKTALDHVKPTIFCIHGNHEMRPHRISSYKTKKWNGGIVWYEEEYPSLLFAKDGEIYNLEGLRHIVIGGAYSVDKFYRITRGYNWWDDEQPSEEIKRYVERQLKDNSIDVILSHTCPFKYEPIEAFIPGIDESTVDVSTEKWLDRIEESTDYKAWFCGHWHIDKRIDKIHFLFNHFESKESLY